MSRSLVLFSCFCFFALCCFNFSIVFGQTNDRIDLTGKYAGNLKFPSENLNGKATLSVEGNKFLLRGANGSEKIGRITAIKTGGDYVSVALMFEETARENQPFSHSMMSLRLRKTGKNLIFASAPGEEREFRFDAVEETANDKMAKSTEARLNSTSTPECDEPGSAKCGIRFGFVGADELEKTATNKTISLKKNEPKAKALTTKSAGQIKTSPSSFAAATSKNQAAPENKIPEPAKTNENRFSPEATKSEPAAVAEKQAQTLEIAPETSEAKQDETNLNLFKQATDEMRRATIELRRANDEIKTTTDELRRFRSESSAKAPATANTLKAEKSTAKKSVSAAPAKARAASSNKITRKSLVSTKPTAKKPFPAKAKSSKVVSVKSPAKKSGSKSAASKDETKKEPAKPAAQTEKAAAPKPAETKPSPSPTPKPSPSPAGSPNQNANNANVGKGRNKR